MTIVNPLPFNLTNGTTADATQVMADFNEIKNDVNANAAHNGANSDITQLSGLTTPLSPAQGGTGSASAAWAQGYLFGMTLSNDSGGTTSIAIAAGTCSDVANVDFMTLASALTGKVLANAWTVGNGGGLLDTGAVGNNTYHVYIIKRTDTGVVDAIASLSTSSPTLPTNYTEYRRIGSIIRIAGAIKLFFQLGDEFLWNTSPADLNATVGSGRTALSVTVPMGIRVNALFRAGIRDNTNAGYLIFTSPDESDQAPGFPNSDLNCPSASFNVSSGRFNVRTNTSAQIYYRSNFTTSTVFVSTYGYVDTRGRLY